MSVNIIYLVIEAEVKSRITTGEGQTKVIVKVKRVFKKREYTIPLYTAFSNRSRPQMQPHSIKSCNSNKRIGSYK